MGNARIQIFHWRVGSYVKWLPIFMLLKKSKETLNNDVNSDVKLWRQIKEAVVGKCIND